MTPGSDPTAEPLPPMQVAILDEETLARLFEDLAREATDLRIQIRAAGSPRGEAAAPSLSRARELFESGSLQGLQVRYRLAGAPWCDTLLRTPEGVRLVRIASPDR